MHIILSNQEIKVANYIFDRQLEAIMDLYEKKFRLDDMSDVYPALTEALRNSSIEYLEYLSQYYTEILILKDNPQRLFTQRPSIIEYFKNVLATWHENVMAMDEDSVISLWGKLDFFDLTKLN